MSKEALKEVELLEERLKQEWEQISADMKAVAEIKRRLEIGDDPDYEKTRADLEAVKVRYPV
uniref:Peptide chain release factor 1 n=1 Tax=Steinernema glaseri TaxID=37863 RepID=A0A1I7YDA0_9BILA